MFIWTRKRLTALVGGFLLVSLLACNMPAWSQDPGAQNPAASVKASAAPPLSPQAPNGNATWNLTDILWGISRLQDSPQKLTAEQVKVVHSTVSKVVEGTKTVKNFESKVKGILTEEQLAYVQHLANIGALNNVPDLPPGAPGQDPLVQYVVAALEKKAGK